MGTRFWLKEWISRRHIWLAAGVGGIAGFTLTELGLDWLLLWMVLGLLVLALASCLIRGIIARSRCQRLDEATKVENGSRA